MDISVHTHWLSLLNLKFFEYVDTPSFGGFLYVHNVFLQGSAYPLKLSVRHVCLWSGGESVSAPDWPTIQANKCITTAAPLWVRSPSLNKTALAMLIFQPFLRTVGLRQASFLPNDWCFLVECCDGDIILSSSNRAGGKYRSQ